MRILADPTTLYFGITCADPEPSKIAVHTMQRDDNMGGDDHVAVVLDTYGDGRTGYLFQVNAAGARTDGLVSGPEELSLDWDGIWEAKTRRTPDGWTAEIAIPAQTLHFNPGQDRWGFNVGRYVARDRLVLVYAGAALDAKFQDFGRAASLLGLGGLRQGLGLSIAPYGLGRRDADFPAGTASLKGHAGLDVGYNLTPGLNGVFTLNPDFAETEVDTRQINLTRFPLFFPEKRSFFLEGSNQFDFGLGLSESFRPFYSRRVGLYGGRIVPIDAGVKVLGRVGDWGIALLDTQTGSLDGVKSTNLFAGRLTYDVDRHLRLGAIATRGDPNGLDQNTLVGLDAVWRTSTFVGDKNFFVGLWGAKSGGDVGDGRRTSWGVKVDYPNDLWDLSLRYWEFGDSFVPALGFLPRPASRLYHLGAAYQPRPAEAGPFGWVRQFFFELSADVFTNLESQTESWTVFTAPFNVRTQSGEHLEANVQPELERLFVPFEVSSGIFIPPGTYRFTRYRLQAESSEHRPLRVAATVWLGGFYTGHLTQLELDASWTDPSAHLQVGLSTQNDAGTLPEGSFIERLYQLRAVYSFTPDLILSSYLQYDSVSRDLGVNARLRWTLRPGRDVFFVWNRNWREPGFEGRLRLVPQTEQVVLKVRFTFRPGA